MPTPVIHGYSVVVMDHESAESELGRESYRKLFSPLRAAKSFARYRVTKAGGHHCAIVFTARVGKEVDRYVAEYTSSARKHFFRERFGVAA